MLLRFSTVMGINWGIVCGLDGWFGGIPFAICSLGHMSMTSALSAMISMGNYRPPAHRECALITAREEGNVPTGCRNRLINLFTGRQWKRNRDRFSVLVALPFFLAKMCVRAGGRPKKKTTLDNIRMQNIFQNARRQQSKQSHNIADILLGTMNLFLAFYGCISTGNFSILTENNSGRRIELSGVAGISVLFVPWNNKNVWGTQRDFCWIQFYSA